MVRASAPWGVDERRATGYEIFEVPEMNAKYAYSLCTIALAVSGIRLADAQSVGKERPSVLEARVSALEAEVAALKQVLKVGGDDVTLEARGNLRLRSGSDTEIKSSSSLKLISSAETDIKSSSSLKLSSSSSAEMKASSAIRIDAPVIKLNGGTRAIVSNGAAVKSTDAARPIAATVQGNVPTVLVP